MPVLLIKSLSIWNKLLKGHLSPILEWIGRKCEDEECDCDEYVQWYTFDELRRIDKNDYIEFTLAYVRKEMDDYFWPYVLFPFVKLEDFQYKDPST